MDEIIQAIQQLLKAATLTPNTNLYGIKAVLYGDPRKIPATSLPAITVSPVRTDTLLRGSQYDQESHTIEIRLVYNARDFYESDTSKEIGDRVFAVQDAVKKMGKVVAGSHSVGGDSIRGILAKNLELPLTVSGTTTNTAETSRVISTSYPALSNSRGFHTYEVILTLEATTIGDR